MPARRLRFARRRHRSLCTDICSHFDLRALKALVTTSRPHPPPSLRPYPVERLISFGFSFFSRQTQSPTRPVHDPSYAPWNRTPTKHDKTSDDDVPLGVTGGRTGSLLIFSCTRHDSVQDRLVRVRHSMRAVPARSRTRCVR